MYYTSPQEPTNCIIRHSDGTLHRHNAYSHLCQDLGLFKGRAESLEAFDHRIFLIACKDALVSQGLWQ
jgi:hypothetical protein